jgi:hypothetical protein
MQRNGKYFVISIVILKNFILLSFSEFNIKTNRVGLFDETANIIELCDTHARFSPDGEKATSCVQPVSKFINIFYEKNKKKIFLVPH